MKEGEPSPQEIRNRYWEARRAWQDADRHCGTPSEPEAWASLMDLYPAYKALSPDPVCPWCGARIPEVCRCVKTALD